MCLQFLPISIARQLNYCPVSQIIIFRRVCENAGNILMRRFQPFHGRRSGWFVQGQSHIVVVVTIISMTSTILEVFLNFCTYFNLYATPVTHRHCRHHHHLHH